VPILVSLTGVGAQEFAVAWIPICWGLKQPPVLKANAVRELSEVHVVAVRPIAQVAIVVVVVVEVVAVEVAVEAEDRVQVRSAVLRVSTRAGCGDGDMILM
jgi:hypothetical protein